jgi:ABC-type nitrate/sulfonate/bicarbonate transport system permease component
MPDAPIQNGGQLMKLRSTLLMTVLLLIFWQIMSMIVNLSILPSPILVIQALFSELFGELGRHFMASFLRVMASMLLSVSLAAPAGLLLGQSKKLDDLFSPLIYILYPIPKVVFVPIIILFLGVNDLSKIIIMFAILFFQILVLVRDQARSIRPELVISVKSLGAGRRGLFRYVYLPMSIPGILTALRQSVGTAVAVLYIAELIATQVGLGYYIYIQGSTMFNYPNMYAGVVMMALMGLGLYLVIDLLQKKLCPWQFANNKDIG